MTQKENNIPCTSCGFDPSKKVVWSKEFVVNFAWLSGNQLRSNDKGRKGYRYRNYRRGFERVIREYAADVRKAKCFRRVTLTRMWGKGQRAYDKDNLLVGAKPLCDVLTAQNLILDDKISCAEIHYRQEKRLLVDEPGIIIKLEEF